MRATLNIATQILAFADPQESSNPRLKITDWLRNIPGISVEDPRSEGHRVLPGETMSIFNGLRATSTDNTTTFSVTLLPVEGASKYRISWTGGTTPTLRTGRSLTPSGAVFTFAVQTNGSMQLTSDVVAFTGVTPGDIVFIPHTTTGDASNVISVINAGYWQVLSYSSNQSITLVRPADQDFEGVSETVTLTANSQFVAFSAIGVQIGDSVDISAGFSLATQKVFYIEAVTDTFFEVTSSTPLPNQTGIQPSASGIVFYTDIKNFLYLESTQEVIVRVNGDIGNYQRIVPVDPSDPTKPGVFMRYGPVWSLSVYNKSPTRADITVIHAE